MDLDRRRIITGAGAGLSLGVGGCANFLDEPDVKIRMVNNSSRHKTFAVIITDENGNVTPFHGSTWVKRGQEKTFDGGVNNSDDPPFYGIARVLVADGTFENLDVELEFPDMLELVYEETGGPITKRKSDRN